MNETKEEPSQATSASLNDISNLPQAQTQEPVRRTPSVNSAGRKSISSIGRVSTVAGQILNMLFFIIKNMNYII